MIKEKTVLVFIIVENVVDAEVTIQEAQLKYDAQTFKFNLLL